MKDVYDSSWRSTIKSDSGKSIIWHDIFKPKMIHGYFHGSISHTTDTFRGTFNTKHLMNVYSDYFVSCIANLL